MGVSVTQTKKQKKQDDGRGQEVVVKRGCAAPPLFLSHSLSLGLPCLQMPALLFWKRRARGKGGGGLRVC